MNRLITTVLLIGIMICCALQGANAQSSTDERIRFESSVMEALERTEKIKERMQTSRAMRLAKYFRNADSHAGQKNDDPLLEEMLSQLNFGESWEDIRRTQLEWGVSGVSEVVYQNKFMTDDWANERRFRYAYESTLMAEYQMDEWLEENGWQPTYSEQYSYITIDGQPFIDEVLIEDQDGPLRVEISYEGSNIVSAAEYLWLNEEWVLLGEVTFDYDGSDLTETYVLYESGEPEPDYRVIYLDTSPADFYEFLIEQQQEYIPTDGVTLLYLQLDQPGIIEQFWDGSGWQNDFRSDVELEINPEEGVAELLRYTFSEYSGEWVADGRFEIGFGAEDEVLFGRDLFYDEFDEEWIEDYREVFENDENGLPVQILMGEYDSFEDDFFAFQRILLSWDGTIVSVNDDAANLPNAFTLGNAYPNPFNPTTNVPFELNRSGHVTLQAFDMLGRQVATLVNEPLAAGTHTVTFEAGNLASGIYMLRLQTGNQVQTSRVALIK